MICGKRGDGGLVCAMPCDHTGDCETNRGEAIWRTVEEKRLHRFIRICDDAWFVLQYTLLEKDRESMK